MLKEEINVFEYLFKKCGGSFYLSATLSILNTGNEVIDDILRLGRAAGATCNYSAPSCNFKNQSLWNNSDRLIIVLFYTRTDKTNYCIGPAR